MRCHFTQDVPKMFPKKHDRQWTIRRGIATWPSHVWQRKRHFGSPIYTYKYIKIENKKKINICFFAVVSTSILIPMREYISRAHLSIESIGSNWPIIVIFSRMLYGFFYSLALCRLCSLNKKRAEQCSSLFFAVYNVCHLHICPYDSECCSPYYFVYVSNSTPMIHFIIDWDWYLLCAFAMPFRPVCRCLVSAYSIFLIHRYTCSRIKRSHHRIPRPTNQNNKKSTISLYVHFIRLSFLGLSLGVLFHFALLCLQHGQNSLLIWAFLFDFKTLTHI